MLVARLLRALRPSTLSHKATHSIISSLFRKRNEAPTPPPAAPQE